MVSSRRTTLAIAVGVLLTAVVFSAWFSASAPLSRGDQIQAETTYLAQIRNPVDEFQQLATAIGTVRTKAASMKRIQLTTSLVSLDGEASTVEGKVRSLQVIGNSTMRTSDLVSAVMDWVAGAHQFVVGILATIGETSPPPPTAGAVADSAIVTRISSGVTDLLASGTAGTALADAGTKMAAGDSAYATFVHSIPPAVAKRIHLPAVVWITDPSLWSAESLAVFGSDLRTSTSLAATHQVGLVLVSTDPQPIPGGSGPTVITRGSLGITAVVGNSGNVEEASVPIECSVAVTSSTVTGTQAPQTQVQSISLQPGQRTTVACRGITLVPGSTYQLTVTVGPVDGQVSSASTRFSETFTDQM